MRIIEPSSTYLDANGLTPYQFMEKAGRTCYKSENNITDDSAVKFVQGLKKSGHTAMLEHAHVIMLVPTEIAVPFSQAVYNNDIDIEGTFFPLKNFINISDCGSNFVISGSFRSFIGIFDEKFLASCSNLSKLVHKKLNAEYPEVFDDIGEVTVFPAEFTGNKIEVLSRDQFKKYAHDTFIDKAIADKLIMRHLVHTVLFVCDRGITHEFVRHRLCSFAQESTRYCNYSKDKFGNEITFIRPNEFVEDSEEFKTWKDACEKAEYDYFKLLKLEVKPQFARDVLPTSVKTEIIITANEVEWQHVINLRKHGTTGSPHPQIVQSMEMVYDKLCEMSDNRLS